MDDPRKRNIVLGNIADNAFIGQYATLLAEGLSNTNGDNLSAAVEAVEACAQNGGTLYLAGNGGSAAICDHLVCDFIKGTYHQDHPVISTVSMTENVALYTAVANDFGFEEVFAFQVQSRMSKDDVLLCVSSSGNSGNIIAAVHAAKQKGCVTIGMSGFAAGNKLDGAADISLHVPVKNYGVVEDAHSALLHMMVQAIANKRDAR